MSQSLVEALKGVGEKIQMVPERQESGTAASNHISDNNKVGSRMDPDKYENLERTSSVDSAKEAGSSGIVSPVTNLSPDSENPDHSSSRSIPPIVKLEGDDLLSVEILEPHYKLNPADTGRVSGASTHDGAGPNGSLQTTAGDARVESVAHEEHEEIVYYAKSKKHKKKKKGL